jgi:hypothetical protein
MVAYCVAVASDRSPTKPSRLPREAATPAWADRGGERQAGRQRERGGLHGVGRAPGVGDAGARAGAAGDQRQPAVVVHEVQAELSAVVEVLGEVLHGKAALPALRRRAVGRATHALEIADQRSAERPEIDALVGKRAEAEHDLVAARHGEIIRRKVAARGLGDGRVPVEHVDRLRAPPLVELQREVDHLLRQEPLLEFGTGHAQRRHVEVVEHAEPVLDERALAPAHGLAPETHFRRHAAEIEARIGEGIQQPGVALDEVFGCIGQAGALAIALVDIHVVQPGRTHERAVVAVIDRQLGDRLERAAVHARGVVGIAVVDVRRAAATAVRDRDQVAVARLDAPRLAVGQRGVPAARQFAGFALEVECVSSAGHGKRDAAENSWRPAPWTDVVHVRHGVPLESTPSIAPPQSDVRHLQDAVADLLGQHQFGVGGDALQHLVVDDVAGGVGADHGPL